MNGKIHKLVRKHTESTQFCRYREISKAIGKLLTGEIEFEHHDSGSRSNRPNVPEECVLRVGGVERSGPRLSEVPNGMFPIDESSQIIIPWSRMAVIIWRG